MRTLTAHIGLVLSSDVGGTAYLSLFVAGGILLFVSISANILFRLVRRKSL
jgi:phosphate transport system permease protein